MARARGGGAFAVRGRFVHGLATPGELELVEDGLLVVDEAGLITHFATSSDECAALIVQGGSVPPAVLVLDADEFCVPGMIDTHVHAPQYSFTGTKTDLPLMEWLQAYTFPAERQCSDTAFARRVYEALVDRLLSHGTTTVAYYGSIHLDATKALVDICRERGQRAIVGKVAMDQHGSPSYEETTEEALRSTEALIEYCYACEAPGGPPSARLVNPAVTPRFIPTCSDALLSGLGALAKKHKVRGCWVQSHLAESFDEMAFVESLHAGERDADIFDRAGLLTERTVMAHAVHLTPSELHLMASRRAGIACCPLSNIFFAGGDFPLVRAQATGARVGLGTDVAGGYSPSLLVACRHAVCASRRLGRGAGSAEEVGHRRAFWTATRGGAAALGLEEAIGSFARGKQFDAVVVWGGAGVYDSFADAATRRHATSLSDDFERYVNLGDDRNVRAVFVRGRAVVGAAGIERRILSHANLEQESSASDAQPLVAGS